MFNNKIITYVFIYLYMIFGCIKNHTKTLKIKDFIDSQKINIILIVLINFNSNIIRIKIYYKLYKFIIFSISNIKCEKCEIKNKGICPNFINV